MDWYGLAKFLHIVTAIAWAGGGAVIMLLGFIAWGQKDQAEILHISRQSNLLALRWFVPASLLTFVFGVIATTLGSMWSEAWVVLGLVGFAATFCTGNFIIKPTSEKIAEYGKSGNQLAAVAETRKILQIGKFDYTILAIVVADMVFKPSWSDTLLIGTIAILAVGAAMLFIPAALRTSPPESA